MENVVCPCRHSSAAARARANGAALEREQVQRVAGQIAPFDLQVDALALFDGVRDRLHGRAALAERFDDREPAGVFQDRAGHLPVGLGLDRGVDAAVVRDDQHAAERDGRRGQRDERRDRAADGERQEDHEEVQISAHKVVDHADAHALERGQARGDGVQDVAGADTLEIAQRHTLERVADGQPVTRGELIADRLLQPGAEIVEQEAEEHQNDLDHDALPDPRGVERRSARLRVDQQPDRIGGQRQRHGREDVREERHDEARVEPPFAFAAPVDDPFYRFEHGLTPPLPRTIPPSSSRRCAPATCSCRGGNSPAAAPACLRRRSGRSGARRCCPRF